MNSAYLVLDMQNDLVGPGNAGPLAQQAVERRIVEKTAIAIAAARAANVQVGFVRVAFSDDYREGNQNSQVFGPIQQNGLLKLSSRGGAVLEALDMRPGDWQFVKHRVSPFHGTPLELMLRRHGVQRLLLSGVSTQAVVQAAVRDAHDRDFDVVLLEDCCAAHTLDEHRNSVASIGRFCRPATAATAFTL